MPGVVQFMQGQLLQTPPLPTTSLSSRAILITGANSGLGLEAAKHLLRLDCAHIVLACRTIAKSEAAKKEILASREGATTTQISCHVLNLADFASVAAFTDEMAALPRLDAAILNAGVDLTELTLASGYETTLTVNVLGTFLLALALLPKLRESATRFQILPRICVIGSAVHFWANTKSLTGIGRDEGIFKKLSEEKWAVDEGHAPIKGEARYFLSKLLVMLCVVQLAKLIAAGEKDGKPFVVVNNVAPGFCRTSLFRNYESAASKVALKAIGRPADVGARTLVHGGCEAGRESHGEYLSESKVKGMSKWCLSTEGRSIGERVWGEVVGIAEGVKEGVGRV